MSAGRAPKPKKLRACAQLAASVRRWDNRQPGSDRSNHGDTGTDDLGHGVPWGISRPDVARAVDRDRDGLVQAAAGIEAAPGDDCSGTGESGHADAFAISHPGVARTVNRDPTWR